MNLETIIWNQVNITGIAKYLKKELGISMPRPPGVRHGDRLMKA